MNTHGNYILFGRLIFINTEIPEDAEDLITITIAEGKHAGLKGKARRLFWKFYLIT